MEMPARSTIFRGGRMSSLNNLGRTLIYLGLLLAALGFIIHFWGENLSWLGHLPGDIRIERENFKFYFPLASLIVISLVINLIIWLIRFFL